MKKKPLTTAQAFIKYLLILYTFVLVAILTIAVQSFAQEPNVEPCEIRFIPQTIVVQQGSFESCLDHLGQIILNEISSSEGQRHSKVVFVIDRLFLENDGIVKSKLLAQDGAAVEFFLGERFFSNPLWSEIDKKINLEFRINNHVIYKKDAEKTDLTVNLAETIVLSQLL